MRRMAVSVAGQAASYLTKYESDWQKFQLKK